MFSRISFFGGTNLGVMEVGMLEKIKKNYTEILLGSFVGGLGKI